MTLCLPAMCDVMQARGLVLEGSARARVCARVRRGTEDLIFYACMYVCSLLFCCGVKSNMCHLPVPLGANVKNRTASASGACCDSV